MKKILCIAAIIIVAFASAAYACTVEITPNGVVVIQSCAKHADAGTDAS